MDDLEEQKARNRAWMEFATQGRVTKPEPGTPAHRAFMAGINDYPKSKAHHWQSSTHSAWWDAGWNEAQTKQEATT